MYLEKYVDYEYYSNTFGGRYDEEDIEQYLLAASDMVFAMVIVCDVDEYQQSAYNKAVCYEAEKLYLQGGLYGSRYGVGLYKSVSLGDFSISSKDSDYYDDYDELSYIALNMLDNVGLLYRGG